MPVPVAVRTGHITGNKILLSPAFFQRFPPTLPISKVLNPFILTNSTQALVSMLYHVDARTKLFYSLRDHILLQPISLMMIQTSTSIIPCALRVTDAGTTPRRRYL